MRVLVIGAGAAGSAFAALLAETGRYSVTVVERDAAADRPGLGITMRNDAMSFLGLDEHLAAIPLEGRAFWRGGDVVVDLPNPPGAHLVCFARAELISVLRARCERAGVTMRFGVDAGTLAESELAEYDLIVAADGAASALRERYDAAFTPRIEYGRNIYGWFGVAAPLPKLTVMLAEEASMLAWGYRYSDSASTFIVECSPAAFERAGLRDAPADRVAEHLSTVFAEQLGGARVTVGQAPRWSRFPAVSCAALADTTVALIGDAGHTTHFSQGFGTMFAFDDALALCDALAENADVAAALACYNTIQMPKVAEYQEITTNSMRWGETLVDAAERGDDAAVRESIAARWPGNAVPPGPLARRAK